MFGDVNDDLSSLHDATDFDVNCRDHASRTGLERRITRLVRGDAIICLRRLQRLLGRIEI